MMYLPELQLVVSLALGTKSNLCTGRGGRSPGATVIFKLPTGPIGRITAVVSQSDLKSLRDIGRRFRGLPSVPLSRFDPLQRHEFGSDLAGLRRETPLAVAG